jgi:hypothetical protein
MSNYCADRLAGMVSDCLWTFGRGGFRRPQYLSKREMGGHPLIPARTAAVQYLRLASPSRNQPPV